MNPEREETLRQRIRTLSTVEEVDGWHRMIPEQHDRPFPGEIAALMTRKREIEGGRR